MKKKILALGAIAILLMSLCGCAQYEAKAASSQETLEEDKSLAGIEEEVYKSFLESGNQSVSSIDPGLEMGYTHYLSSSGDAISLKDLQKQMSISAKGQTVNCKFSYTIISSSNRKVLALKATPTDYSMESETFLFCYYDDTLHLSDTYYEDAETTATLCKNGYLEIEKLSPDAGAKTSYCFVDAAGKVREIYTTQEVSGELIKEHTDEKIYKKAYRRDMPTMSVVIYDFDGKTYYDYVAEGEELSEKDQDFIIRTSQAGYTWLTSDEMKTIQDKKLKELKLMQDFFDTNETAFFPIISD